MKIEHMPANLIRYCQEYFTKRSPNLLLRIAGGSDRHNGHTHQNFEFFNYSRIGAVIFMRIHALSAC